MARRAGGCARSRARFQIPWRRYRAASSRRAAPMRSSVAGARRRRCARPAPSTAPRACAWKRSSRDTRAHCEPRRRLARLRRQGAGARPCRSRGRPGRDRRPRRRIGLRQDHAVPRADGPCEADRGARQLRGHGARGSPGAGRARLPPPRPDAAAGRRGRAVSAHDGAGLADGADPYPCPALRRDLRADARHPAGGSGSRPMCSTNTRTRSPAARQAGRHRARPRAAAEIHRRRRADRRARRVGARRSAQPPARPEDRVRTDLSARQPQPERRAPRHGPHGRDVSRRDRGGRPDARACSRRRPTPIRRRCCRPTR